MRDERVKRSVASVLLDSYHAEVVSENSFSVENLNVVKDHTKVYSSPGSLV